MLQTSGDYETYKFIVKAITRLYDYAVVLKEIHTEESEWKEIMNKLDSFVDDHLMFAERVLPWKLYEKLLDEQIIDRIIELLGL